MSRCVSSTYQTCPKWAAKLAREEALEQAAALVEESSDILSDATRAKLASRMRDLKAREPS